MAWLQSLELSNAMHIVKRDMLVAEIEHLDQQIRLIEKQLETFSRNQPMVTLLRTIPGVGIRTAEAVAAYLDDPKRFQNSKQIGAYFGLVPKQDQSGNTNRLGRINREGPAVIRKLLVEATWQSVRRSPTVLTYYERIMRGDAKRRKIATVATAHYLCRVMWSMMKHQRPWVESVAA